MSEQEFLELGNDQIGLILDPARGADVLSLRDQGSGTELLFSTPWRRHADLVRRDPMAVTTTDPVAGYLEQYRGGWNTLCPSAGAPRSVHGAPQGFHGEAVRSIWTVTSHGRDRAALELKLFSLPILIERELVVDGTTVVQADRLTNLSDVDLEFDYVSHPAFGGTFLEGRCELTTSARWFTPDPEVAALAGRPDESRTWGEVDLGTVPSSGERAMAFGWLSDFDGEASATLFNHDLGLGVRVGWDDTVLPYAWLWQELGWTDGFPWFRRARALAIEPSSTATSGPGRRSMLRLAPHAQTTITVTLAVLHGRDGE